MNSNLAPIRTTDTLADLYSALDRLLHGETIYVKAPYSINKRTVCLEAGRDTSTIRATAKFAEIRRAIDLHEVESGASQRKTSHGDRRQRKSGYSQKQTSERVSRLEKRLREQDRALDDAAGQIYALYRQLRELEDERSQLILKLDRAAKSSVAVRKSFTLLGIQQQIDQAVDGF